METLAVGLANFSSSTEINWGVILALGTAATIMFSLIQKHFVEGMTAGAVRGRVTENSRCGAFAVYAKDTVDCKGAVPILRNEMHVSVWPGKKLAIMNVTRVAGDPLDDVSRSEAICQLRKQAVAFSRFLIQDVPGFEEAYLSKVGRGAFAHRASRSLVGEYTLTEADFRQGRSFADSIVQSCFPSDRHDTKGSSMPVVESNGGLDIPFRWQLLFKKVNPADVDGFYKNFTRAWQLILQKTVYNTGKTEVCPERLRLQLCQKRRILFLK